MPRRDRRRAGGRPRPGRRLAAGPGSGKTATFVGRVLALLDGGAAPHQILTVTFSDRAASEMRAQLRAAAPDHAHALTIATLHALGLEILRRHPGPPARAAASPGRRRWLPAARWSPAARPAAPAGGG
jgi:hypothetical protein